MWTHDLAILNEKRSSVGRNENTRMIMIAIPNFLRNFEALYVKSHIDKYPSLKSSIIGRFIL